MVGSDIPQSAINIAFAFFRLDFDSDESVEDAESSSSDEGLSQIASPVEIEVREGVQSSSVENRIAHSGANENLATTEPDAVEIEDSKESAEKSNERNVKNEDELSGKQETVKHDEKAILQSSVAKEDTSVSFCIHFWKRLGCFESIFYWLCFIQFQHTFHVSDLVSMFPRCMQAASTQPIYSKNSQPIQK